MRITIGHKIFAAALVVLVLMAAVAIHSVTAIEEIGEDLDLVATKQLPLTDLIGEVNAQVLEHGLLLQRLFALPHESAKARARIAALDARIEEGFARAYAILEQERQVEHPPPAIDALQKAVRAVEKDFETYEAKGLHLLNLHEQGQEGSFAALIPEFNALQNAVDEEINVLRAHIDAEAGIVVERANHSQRALLYFNVALTGLAVVLSLATAAWITLLLVRNIRHLVTGADEVASGNLDITVPEVTRDEIGTLARAFNAMIADLRLKERIKDTFGKYLDPRIVSRLIDNPDLAELGGRREEMTVMFVDLQGYTTLSESLPPADLVAMLNRFLGLVAEEVAARKGVVNDFLGDAVMAYWGPPFTGADDHAPLACDTARAIRTRFDRFRAEVAEDLGDRLAGMPIAMRIGIATGHMVAGNIGSKNSRKYSVVGDPVNLGARLESINKEYGTRVMLSERTHTLAGASLAAREVDLVRVKGKAQPTRIYELLADGQPASDRFAEGLTAYRQQRWDDAEAAFRTCLTDAPDDPVPPVFLARVAAFRADPPGPDWDGVWGFLTK